VQQMMDPTRNTTRKQIDLCKIVRQKATLEKAWRHVEKRVAASNDPETKKALAKFRGNPSVELNKISRNLARATFVFERQRGYPKPRKG